jgi:hypothetical protein
MTGAQFDAPRGGLLFPTVHVQLIEYKTDKVYTCSFTRGEKIKYEKEDKMVVYDIVHLLDGALHLIITKETSFQNCTFDHGKAAASQVLMSPREDSSHTPPAEMIRGLNECDLR